jgi:hypothetical protein
MPVTDPRVARPLPSRFKRQRPKLRNSGSRSLVLRHSAETPQVTNRPAGIGAAPARCAIPHRAEAQGRAILPYRHHRRAGMWPRAMWRGELTWQNLDIETISPVAGALDNIGLPARQAAFRAPFRADQPRPEAT